MKFEKKITFFILFYVICSFYSIAQNKTAAPDFARKNQDFWKPLILKSDGSPVNTLNGVAFYKRPAECNSEKVVCLKMINSNNYSVKVEWKFTPEEATSSVTIQPSSEIEGNCASEIQNLVIPKKGKTEEQKKFFLSHLTVSEIKK